MAKPIRFHLDEHVAPALARALRRRNVDVTTSAEVGLLGVDDDTQLSFAFRENRVLITNDEDFLVLHANGVPHSGIAYCHQDKYRVGGLISAVLLLYDCMTAEEMTDQVEYL